MSNIFSNINAGLKVTYDKISDYCSYYTFGDECYYYESMESFEDDKENTKEGEGEYAYAKAKAIEKEYEKAIEKEKEEEEKKKCSSKNRLSIDLEDTLQDYEDYLKISNYEDENINKRIFPELGYYKEYSIALGPPTHIIDNIYLGSAFNAANKKTLKEYNFQFILNITKEIQNYYEDEFEYKKFNIYDNNKHSIIKYLDKTYKAIKQFQEKSEGNILIHCFMGASRSASVVIYYLTRREKDDTGKLYTVEEALNFCREKRETVNPTFRLIKDLAKTLK